MKYLLRYIFPQKFADKQTLEFLNWILMRLSGIHLDGKQTKVMKNWNVSGGKKLTIEELLNEFKKQ